MPIKRYFVILRDLANRQLFKLWYIFYRSSRSNFCDPRINTVV